MILMNAVRIVGLVTPLMAYVSIQMVVSNANLKLDMWVTASKNAIPK